MSHEASTVHGDQSVEELRRELAEAREQQAATSEILRVIGETRTDIRPVFDTIMTSSVRLCGARMGAVFRFDGELVHFVAQYDYPSKAIEILPQMYPRPPLQDQISGRAISPDPLRSSRTCSLINCILASKRWLETGESPSGFPCCHRPR